jgi:hypothetical protein
MKKRFIGNFFLLFAIFLVATGSILANEQFQFQITVSDTDLTFFIPTSGGGLSPNKAYNWNINWGDGNSDTSSGISEWNSEGILHAYSAADIYTITITPNGGNDAWLAAFGFYALGDSVIQSNKSKYTNILSELTPLMTRTQAQLNGTDSDLPSYEWAYTFSGCNNLISTGPGFSSAWDSIGEVGDYFANNMFRNCSDSLFTMSETFTLPKNIITTGSNFANEMFYGCSGESFTMNDIYNLPQGIITIGNGFACAIFEGCSGDAFTMNEVFNLPQDITTVGRGFACDIFSKCSGSSFTMNSIFNLPQRITSIADYFACEMFEDCSGNAFTMNEVFNLPQDITATGPYFVNSMFSKCSGSSFTMNDVFNLPQGLTVAASFFGNDLFFWCYGSSFAMNDIFNLPQELTTVGDYFAGQMFTYCSGESFTMNDTFNLPPGITTIGDRFALGLFAACSGDAFTMNEIFNLPQNLTTVDEVFVSVLFAYCSGSSFTMNEIFNFPQNITTTKWSFANRMFANCFGEAFTMNEVFNLPQNITEQGPNFAHCTFSGCSGDSFRVNDVFRFGQNSNSTELSTAYFQAFYNVTAPQERTVASILGTLQEPDNNRETFSGATGFSDLAITPVNWGGGNTSISINNGYIPTEVALGNAYPSPFNASTKIEFSLPESQHIKLQIFDVTGRLVETLVDKYQAVGKWNVTWNADNYNSGIYIYRLQFGKKQISKKILLLK